MQRFLSFLQSQSHATLESNLRELITRSARKLSLRGADLLYTENQPINNIYFLLEGFVYSTERFEGRDILTRFWEPSAFVLPHGVNRTTYMESAARVELLVDSTVIQIQQKDILQALDYPSGKYLYNHFVNLEFIKHHRLAHFLRLCSVKERVKHLTDHYPILFRHLSHELLASFVGTSRPNLTNVLGDLNRRD